MSEHGTATRYTNGGCRCDECRAANTEYMRRYRRLKGGVAPATRAQRKAEMAMVKYVRAEMPDVWRGFLEDARRELGLPVDDVGPGGQFTKPIAHGTNGGYRAHHYRGEAPCDLCRTAHNKYSRERAAQRRAAS